MRTAAAIVLVALAVACGSKSGLDIPDARTRPRDARVNQVPDAGEVHETCIELPYLEPPREIEVSLVAQVVSADVFFLVDVTGSMSEEISQIRAQIRDQIIPGLVEAIPDVRFGVGRFADFPRPDLGYGEERDEVFRLVAPSTADVAEVQNAVFRLPLQGGSDGPEALVEALYLTATGEGLGPYVPPASCPPGTVGYPCFRARGSRIILAFTDAPSHNGPEGFATYEGLHPAPHTYEAAVNALRAIGAKVLGLYSGGDGGMGLIHLEVLGRDTGAVRSNGAPIVFAIGRDGRLLVQSVIQAVRAFVDEVPIGIDVVLQDVEGDAFDATAFVERVIAARAEPPEGAVSLGDRFEDVRPGTRVFFRIVLANDDIPQTDEPQSFLLRVVLRGDGVTTLREMIVRVLVPPVGGAGCEET